jgi:hypothetical protein
MEISYIMKWVASYEISNIMKYEIEYDPGAGFYLYVYENNKCIKDYLQDTLECAMEYAMEDYGVKKTNGKAFNIRVYEKKRARIQEEYKDADLRQLLIDALKE